MNKYIIAIKKLNGLYVNTGSSKNSNENQSLVYTLNADMVQLGYVMSRDLFDAVATMPKAELKKVHMSVIKALRMIVGADVVYAPMYPNFPEQVMDASDEELFVNAITHYWSTYGHNDLDSGGWLPQYTKKERPFFPEDLNVRVLDLVSKDAFNNIFTKIMSSNDSISGEDKEIVQHFLRTPELTAIMPEKIPFKENLCMVAADCLDRFESITPYVTNTTDILRIATFLSEGDVSLGSNTKFKSLPRGKRKILIQALENVISEEDVARHANKWVKLSHNLHVGDYSQKVYDVMKKVRENVKIKTFNGQVEFFIENKDLPLVLGLLKQRPSELARRLDFLLRSFNQDNHVIAAFESVVSEIPTKVLFQVLGHLKNRNKEVTTRVVFPKGSTQKAVLLDEVLPALQEGTILSIGETITYELKQRFSTLEELGNVYLDPALRGAPLPTQQRSASTAVSNVARGTRLDFGDKDFLRLFIYWKGQDIDLSATFHDEDLKAVGQVSYTRLKDESVGVYHSGDITSAPHGASEFIDIDINKFLAKGARYVAMNVLVYSGPNFADHEVVYAGWMTREKPMSNEIYDPKTVENKFNLTSDASNAIPVIFDLKERKAIWVDLATMKNSHRGGNNVQSNRASIEQVTKAMMHVCDNRATLYDLFEAHGLARGTLVEDRETADVVYALDGGDVNANDITVINTDYMVG